MKHYAVKTIVFALASAMVAAPALAQPNNNRQSWRGAFSEQPAAQLSTNPTVNNQAPRTVVPASSFNAAQPRYTGQLQNRTEAQARHLEQQLPSRTEVAPSRNRTAVAPVRQRSGASASGTPRVNPVAADLPPLSDGVAADGHKRCMMHDNTTGKTDLNRACMVTMRDSEGAGSHAATGSQQGLSDRQKGLLMFAGGVAVVGGTAYYLDQRGKRRERNKQQAQAAPATPAAAQAQQTATPQTVVDRTSGTSRQRTVGRPAATASAHNQQADSMPVNIEQELRQNVIRPGSSLGSRSRIGSNAQTFNEQPTRTRVVPAASADPVRDNQAKAMVRPAFGN